MYIIDNRPVPDWIQYHTKNFSRRNKLLELNSIECHEISCVPDWRFSTTTVERCVHVQYFLISCGGRPSKDENNSTLNFVFGVIVGPLPINQSCISVATCSY